ncbi:MAG: EF-hand domain-containing protein [Xanthomonadales bacterium]|nr:EF-hand domain-containing protein [Xanthomonadales bacterium]MCB1575966.1 EF-hand domain-containing protein [Xanthomonadales bacterium]
MKLKGFRTVLLAMAALAAPSAFAAQATPSTQTVSHPQQWTPADRNRDGQLSREELIPFPAFTEHFDAMDTNRDGKISRPEYAAWLESRKQ